MGRTNAAPVSCVVLALLAFLAGCGGGGGGGDAPPADNPGTAPTAPTGISAVAGDGSITVSWGAVSGATSYNIYWSTTAGVTKTSGTKIENAARPYIHTGLTNGTPYTYVVTTVNSAGESVESAEVSATPALPVASLRVRVVNTYYNEKGAFVPGATVVLGDSNGVMIATRITDSNGEVTFSNPPANATVTAAVHDPGRNFYSLQTYADVNVSAVTLDLEAEMTLLGTANVTVADSLGTHHWVVFPGKRTGTGSAAITVDVSEGTIQDDGNVSFVVLGYDASNNLVGYGVLLDQTFAAGMNASVNLDQPFTSHIPVNLNGIPSTAVEVGVGANLVATRKNGVAVGDLGTSVLFTTVPSSTTLSLPVVAGYGDAVEYEAWADFDEDGDGNLDTSYTFGKWELSAAGYTLDFSTFPAFPSNLQVSGADPERPILSWSGNDASAQFVWARLEFGSAAGGWHDYHFRSLVGRNNIAFPELPDSLAAFRLTTAVTFPEIYVENGKCNIITGYDHLLTFIDQYYGGTQSLNGLACPGSGRYFQATASPAPISGGSATIGISAVASKSTAVRKTRSFPR